MYKTAFDILGAAEPRNSAHPVLLFFFLNVVHCFSQTEGKASRLEEKEVKDGTQNRGNTYGLHLRPSHTRSEAPFTAALGQGRDELLEAELLHRSSWHEQVTRAGASSPRPALGPQ